jgi:hypothetical protein
MMPITAASSSVMRSSTSRCFSAASRPRIVSRRAESLARIAVFMSSVICSLRVMVLGASLNQKSPLARAFVGCWAPPWGAP